ncbi:MAG TPA: LPS export ABC transporter periplasmic protein LptC [Methylovirgula sp.]|nr:LPS export ABC transporter periplasmic protein LptC [Methylovirgula sp.]
MTDARARGGPGASLDLPVGRPQRAIRIARWHSIFVRHVRILIIAGCSLAIIALGIVVFFDPFKRIPHNLSVSQVGLQGSIVTLQAPSTKGFRQNGQPFELTSVSGTQDILNPHIIKLVGVNAKIGMDDASTAKVTARTGVYDSSADIVWLRTDVRISNEDSGYDMHMRSATVDLNSGALLSEEPVTVTMDSGSTITADRMEISDNGHKVTFQGQVQSIVPSSGWDDEGSGSQEAAQ